MSGRLYRESHAAVQVRMRLAWLSAQEASVRLMGYTRPFTLAEQVQLAMIEAESASLLRALDRLAGRALPLAQLPAPRPAGPKPVVAA